MPRKPVPQQDANVWGTILNEFLEVSLDANGLLKNNAVTNSALADGAVSEAKLDSALVAKVNSGGGGGVPTTYALGRVRYSSGWPGARPSGYAYIDWIKSSASDPDPSTGLLLPGDTISEWS